MIAWLEGVLRERHPAAVVLDVRGVGYELHVPVGTFARLPPAGATVALHVYTQVREDAIQLYGFAAVAEKALFVKLIAVNGVGPKLALQMLSGLEPGALAAAIRQADYARLTAINGVGKKTAERVVMELRDKLAAETDDTAADAGTASAGAGSDVVSALVNLGYPQPLAEKAVARALARDPTAGFDALFKQCMQSIA